MNIKLTYDTQDAIWVAQALELDGCITHGATLEEAFNNLAEAIRLHIESLEERMTILVAHDNEDNIFIARVEGSEDLITFGTTEAEALHKLATLLTSTKLESSLAW